jgi:hypothetical protein
MLSKITKKTLSVVFTLGLATTAKADTAVFPFTYTVQTGDQITATGSFTTDGYGSLGLATSPPGPSPLLRHHWVMNRSH